MWSSCQPQKSVFGQLLSLSYSPVWHPPAAAFSDPAVDTPTQIQSIIRFALTWGCCIRGSCGLKVGSEGTAVPCWLPQGKAWDGNFRLLDGSSRSLALPSYYHPNCTLQAVWLGFPVGQVTNHQAPRSDRRVSQQDCFADCSDAALVQPLASSP